MSAAGYVSTFGAAALAVLSWGSLVLERRVIIPWRKRRLAERAARHDARARQRLTDIQARWDANRDLCKCGHIEDYHGWRCSYVLPPDVSEIPGGYDVDARCMCRVFSRRRGV